MGKLAGKVALITGSGFGIGRASALLFAEEGAKVAVNARTPGRGPETVKMIKAKGGEAFFVQADVSKSDDVKRMIKTTLDTYGRIDILFNHAGISQGNTYMADTSEEEWDNIIDTNLKGIFLGSKYTIPVMLKQGGGVIINTSSVLGIVGGPRRSVYAASKAAIIQLSKVMAYEYGSQNIRVNCICPGAVETGLMEKAKTNTPGFAFDVWGQVVPMGRQGQPKEIAQAALYLASDDSTYVNGAALVIDGGWITSLPVPQPPKGK